MANHKSSEKRIRRNESRNEVVRSRLRSIRTFCKSVEAAISEGNKEQALAAFKLAESNLMKGVRKGAIKLGTAARRTSRLSAKIKSL